MLKPIEFKAGTLTAMTAILHEIDNVRLADALQVMLGGMGEFFAGEATIIDLTQLSSLPSRVDWAGLLSLLRRYGLQPVALRGAPVDVHDSARKAGLAILSDQAIRPTAPQPEPASSPQLSEPAPTQAQTLPEALGKTMVVERTVRSGQQIYARGGDLVILAGVSHGAEVIADGTIHCYGPLRGRALAGAAGSASARIITTNFGPELVAIAGVYRTFEQGIPPAIAGRAAHAVLRHSGETQTLMIEPLQLD